MTHGRSSPDAAKRSLGSTWRGSGGVICARRVESARRMPGGAEIQPQHGSGGADAVAPPACVSQRAVRRQIARHGRGCAARVAATTKTDAEAR